MIGYFTPLEEGELLYSAVARTAALLFPNKSYQQIAEAMLGSRYATFGCLLPNHGSSLLERIPAASGVDRAQVLDASVFHTITPFLEAAERAKLEDSIFFAERQGLRRWFRRKSGHLKYCWACAREDAANGRPETWRVNANHPIVSCCPKHRICLIETPARIDCEGLHAPEKWIKPTDQMPAEASSIEVHIASDVQWLMRQRSQFLPGFDKVAYALHRRLRNNPDFVWVRGRLDISKIHGELRRLCQSECEKSDPTALTSNKILSLSSRETIQRYSIVGFLVGATIAEIVTEASNLTDLPQAENGEITPASLDAARVEFARYVGDHSGASRSMIRSACPAAEIICRKDRAFYERTMPPPRPKALSRKIDWGARDSVFERKIVYRSDALGTEASSIERILRAVGARRGVLKHLKSRLPKSWAAASALKRAWIRQQREKGLRILLSEIDRKSQLASE